VPLEVASRLVLALTLLVPLLAITMMVGKPS